MLIEAKKCLSSKKFCQLLYFTCHIVKNSVQMSKTHEIYIALLFTYRYIHNLLPVPVISHCLVNHIHA